MYTFLFPTSEFSQSQYADMYMREKLSAKINIPEETIKVDQVGFFFCYFRVIKVIWKPHSASLTGLVLKQKSKVEEGNQTEEQNRQ